MATQEVLDLDKARRIYDAYVSPRSRTLALFEAEVEGTRFDDRPNWFHSDRPIFERRPCVIYHAVDSSIQSKIDLLLGAGRFPCITASPDEDEGEAEAEDGLSEDESEAIDALILSITREAKLPALFRETYQSAQGCGTAVAMLGAKGGRLFAETLPAKWCTCKRDELCELTEVTVEYPYIQQVREGNKWRAKCFLYRRVIDRTSDTIFAPGEGREDGAPPSWRVQAKAAHNLGFVPVIWYKHMAPLAHVEGDDGFPVHRTILPELEALHYALSQRHHGALNSLPQIVEIGVEAGYNPTGDGCTADAVMVTEHGGPPGPANPVRGRYQSVRQGGRTGARKKGPNHTWQYENPEVKVEAINTPGEALESLANEVKDLRAKICETLAWVPLDPDSIKYAATVSGRALEVLRERELNRVSYDREMFGDQMILGVVQMLLRIAAVLGDGLRTPRLKACRKILEGFGSGPAWQAPVLNLRWPAFFLPSAEDNEKTVNLADKAYTGGMITRRTQVQAVARIFGIENIEAYCEALEEEAEERAEQARQEMADSIAGAHAHLTGDDSDEGTARAGKPRGNPQNRGRNPRAAAPAAKAKALGKPE